MGEITVKRNSVASWAIEIDGEYKGSVHMFRSRGWPVYCHDLRIGRGARFNSQKAAVNDLVKRATNGAAR